MQEKPRYGFMLHGYHFFSHSPVISPEEKLLEVQFDGKNNFLACFLRPTVGESRIMLSQSRPNYQKTIYYAFDIEKKQSFTIVNFNSLPAQIHFTRACATLTSRTATSSTFLLGGFRIKIILIPTRVK